MVVIELVAAGCAMPEVWSSNEGWNRNCARARWDIRPGELGLYGDVFGFPGEICASLPKSKSLSERLRFEA